jgi:hypothetical protein
MSTREEIALERYVREAKGLSALPGIRWDDMVWVLQDNDSAVSQRSHKSQSKSLWFTKLMAKGKLSNANSVPLTAPFADAVKAWIRHRASDGNQQCSTHIQAISAAGHLEEILLKTTGAACLCDLTLDMFRQTELLTAARGLSETACYAISTILEDFSQTIDSRGLARSHIGYKTSLKEPPRGDRLDTYSQTRGLEKMPSDHQLECLAKISNDPLNDTELLFIRHVDLLVATGFRIGEALTLPHDCWVERRGSNGQQECGIRYWPEKGGHPIVKWLPTKAVPLARRAIDDIRELCNEARGVALWLEEHPGKVPALPGYADSDVLIGGVLARALGFSSSTAVKNLGMRPVGKRGGAPCYRVGDIREAFAKKRFDRPLLVLPNGAKQMLSESLSVIFPNQVRANHPTLRCLARPIGYESIRAQLGGYDVIESAFDRHGFKERDGSRMYVSTHAFRHWLNTMADRGGLSDAELARWMGRRDLKQNAAYKHGTAADRAQKARELIVDGKLQGQKTDVYHALPSGERAQFLDAAVGAVEFTEFGACFHDFAATPCPHHQQCLRGCADYSRTVGSEGERRKLLAQKQLTEVKLQKYRTAAAEGQYGAENFLAREQQLLEGINRALSVDDHLFPASEAIG